MRQPSRVLALCLLGAVLGVCRADDPTEKFSVDQAVQLVDQPVEMFDMDAYPFGRLGAPQIYERLMKLWYRTDYQFEEEHAAVWLKCMRSGERSIYTRLCAAYFLLDQSKEARGFVLSQLHSDEVRYRSNAVEVLKFHVGGDSKKRWGVQVMIQFLADGSIDREGVNRKIPYEQWRCFFHGATDDFCRSLAHVKEREAVPALISVLERRPESSAAYALGEIGDERAIPVLLKVLTDGSRNRGIVTALGQLKAKAAVPVLISCLGKTKSRSGLNDFDMGDVLETLLAIGDPSAIDPIRAYLATNPSKSITATANRVLAQFDSPDPAQDLLDLLAKETDEYERSDLIRALIRYPDARVVKELAKIARTSDSANLRSHAIWGLKTIGGRESLLIVASLLDEAWPPELKAQFDKSKITFEECIPKKIHRCLTLSTEQDFGDDRAKWEAWIRTNVEPGFPMDRHKP